MKRWFRPAAPRQPRQVTPFQILAYVLPNMPLAALGLPVVVHLPQFYHYSCFFCLSLARLM